MPKKRSERFTRSPEAKSYYENINKKSETGKFKLYFSFYYLCFMVGFKILKINSPIENNKDFLPNPSFPHEFRSQSPKILGALANAELMRKGIEMDKEKVKAELRQIIDANSPSDLSSHGLDLLDKYAESGFQDIQYHIPDVDELDIFMKRYYEHYILSN